MPHPRGRAQPGRLTAGVVRRMRAVGLIAFDVDGVMTEGRLPYLMGDADPTASREFHVQDGLAIARAISAGLPCAVVTSKVAAAVRERCADLSIVDLVFGREDKQAALAELAGRYGVSLSEVAFMGDDLLDLPAMTSVGLAIAPFDAAPEVLRIAHFVTHAPGGRGCVREALRQILLAKHLWQDIVAGCAGRQVL